MGNLSCLLRQSTNINISTNYFYRIYNDKSDPDDYSGGIINWTNPCITCKMALVLNPCGLSIIPMANFKV